MLMSQMLPDARISTIIPEFPTEHGIVDLAAFILDPARLAARLGSGVLLRGRLAADVALAVARGTRTRAAVRERLRVTDRSAARGIAMLREAGLLAEGAGGRLYVSPLVTHPPLTKAIAIELKVSHWRDATRQAVQHALFADESYVAMDLAFFRRYASSSQLLKERGIGLIGVDVRSSTAVVLQQARTVRRTDLRHRLMASEEVVRRVLDGATELRQGASPSP
jgi:hypothetical protein